MVLAPIARGRKGEYKKELEAISKAGFRARIEGELVTLDEPLKLDKRKNHTIEAVIDRLVVKPGIEARLESSIQTALKWSGGLVVIAVVNGEERLYSEKLACPNDGTSIPQLEPRSFSFNSPYGACPTCNGVGSTWAFDPLKVIADPSKPLLDGGLGPGSASAYMTSALNELAAACKIDLSIPFEDFPKKTRTLLLNGNAQNPRNPGGSGRLLWPLQRNVSRMADGLYVADRVSGLSGASLASRKPGGAGERDIHRRVHRNADRACASADSVLGVYGT